VNDGSTDNTIEVLNGMKKRSGSVHVMDLKSNVGKAEAVRQAMLEISGSCHCDYAGYFDADLATPLSEVNNMLNYSGDDPVHDIICGSRLKRMGADIRRNEFRHYTGRIFASFASIILKLPFYDTQCGAKLVKFELINELFRDRFISRWLFDIEMIARLVRLKGYDHVLNRGVLEYPLLEWIEKKGSKIRFLHMLRVPYELLKINSYYKLSNR
jgi:glycosyltransferase involved in cell wall biosynthesis